MLVFNYFLHTLLKYNYPMKIAEEDIGGFLASINGDEGVHPSLGFKNILTKTVCNFLLCVCVYVY